MHEQALTIAGKTKNIAKRRTQLENICRIIFGFQPLDAVPNNWFSLMPVFCGKKGVRGKYYEAMQNGYTTIIHQSESSTVVKETQPTFLDEDMQAYFYNSKSVNQALRGLIALVPEK